MTWAARGGLRAPGEKLALCWTLGCLPVFTLPYIFPRFLQYLIPAMAFWVAMTAANAFKGLAYIRQRQVS